MLIKFILNSKQVQTKCNPLDRLIDILREEFCLTGSKEGCGEGECGACTVLLDKKPVTSCIVNMVNVQNKQVDTIEYIATLPEGKILIKCFDENNAVQCGFCFPGFMISAYYYIITDGDPDLEKIKYALSGNVCRCTGYKKIFEAVLKACKLCKGGNHE